MTYDSADRAPAGAIDDAAAAKAVELLRKAPLVMLVTISADGDLQSRPMTIQQVEDDGDLWFFLGAGSQQARAIKADPRVNIAIGHADWWLSVTGQGHLAQDRAKLDELWNREVEAWFPGGKNDPDVALLRVETTSAEYWDSPGGGRVSSLFHFVKSRVTGSRMEGENAATDLP